MIDQKLDERYAEALREGLVVYAHRARHHRRRVRAGLAVSLAALIACGSIAYASRDPGTIQKPLARPIIVTHVGSAVVQLPPAPPGATNVTIVLSCMSPGRCMTPGGGISDADRSVAWASWAGPLEEGDSLPLTNKPDEGNAQVLPRLDPADGLNVIADPDVVWRLYVAYADDWNPAWFTNRSGQTYGLPNASLAPDLIAAWTDDGQLGYTPSDRLLGDGAEPQFHSEADVSAYISADHTPQRLPVFTEDGSTLIGYLTVR
jgi:hypothetical protein